MGKEVRLVRDGHGRHELLLKISLDGQFEVFNLPGDFLGLHPLLPVEEGDLAPSPAALPTTRGS